MDCRETRKRKAEQERQGDFLKKKAKNILPFRRNAVLIITEMLKMNSKHTTVLLDEVLHSIFFLGKLNDPEFSPESILTDDLMLNKLKERFPRPFDLYSSQLPKRGPLSCVLDMIIHMTGRENEGGIIKKLRELTDLLKEGNTNQLVSSTICVSQMNPPYSARYYGVSTCTSGPNPGKIMVGASCLSSWDSYVAGAVMTYYPNKTKKDYFDGTIKLPQHVRCETFSLRSEKTFPPCKSCANLFGLTTWDDHEWPYGNCAEAESLSSLLINVPKVKEPVQPTRQVNREKAERSLLTELKCCLKMMKFKWGKEENFYTPSVERS